MHVFFSGLQPGMIQNNLLIYREDLVSKDMS